MPSFLTLRSTRAMASRPIGILINIQTEIGVSGTFIEILKRWATRQPDEVMAWRTEQIPAVCRIDVKKDAWDDNSFLFEKFFKERKAIINRFRKIFQVQPNVECCDRRYLDLQPHGLQALQDMITFHLEMLLEGNPFLLYMLRVQKWDGC